MEAYFVAVRVLLADLRASSLSRRSSSASSALISRACNDTSSVAARIRARLRSVLGKRTEVCAIGSSPAGTGRVGMSPPVRADVMSSLRSPYVGEPTINPAPSSASRSRLCCGAALITTSPLTRSCVRENACISNPHPSAGGPAVDEPLVNGYWVGPRGGRFYPVATRGFRTVSGRNQRGSPRWPS